MGKWNITVAKSGVIEIEAASENEALEIVNETPLTNQIQWEDSWNVVDVDRGVRE